MHLDSLERDLLGRQVDQGCLIARSGQSGVATGPHLHIQIELTPIGEAPKWVDPALFLNEV
jgi:murein DD-endopeptidase MepM/ murein hydrolase activator NlpD